MRIYKRKRKSGDGKVTTSHKYYVEFNDPSGIKRSLIAFTNKDASEEMGRNIQRLVELRLSGLQPNNGLLKFIESCSEETRASLLHWGVLDHQFGEMGKSLINHLADWKIELEAKGCSKKHIKEFISKVKRLIQYCNWERLSDITSHDFNRWVVIASMENKSIATINHHLIAVKAFCSWLVGEKRMVENPLVRLKKQNAKVDRRRERRALTPEELSHLLEAAEAGGIVHGMTGHVRALLYLLAAKSGLRWSELHSLRKESFHLDTARPYVIIKAEDAKNEKESTLQLPNEVVETFSPHLASLQTNAKAFPGMWQEKGAEMLRVDLLAAGIPFADAQGRVADFHSLRHTFGTHMGQNGVPMAVAKKMMRHSSAELTAGIYTHIGDDDVAVALDKLPKILPCKEPVAPTTGEEAKTEVAENEWPGIIHIIDQMDLTEFPGIINILDQMLDEDEKMDCKMDCFSPHLDGQARTYRDGKDYGAVGIKSKSENKNPLPHNEIRDLILAPPAGFEPATCGLTVRRSTS